MKVGYAFQFLIGTVLPRQVNTLVKAKKNKFQFLIGTVLRFKKYDRSVE